MHSLRYPKYFSQVFSQIAVHLLVWMDIESIIHLSLYLSGNVLPWSYLFKKCIQGQKFVFSSDPKILREYRIVWKMLWDLVIFKAELVKCSNTNQLICQYLSCEQAFLFCSRVVKYWWIHIIYRKNWRPQPLVQWTATSKLYW